ncbi:hypothetical protein Pfo_024561 [Paulownia fortunei]|nr:hypothetical protein Pfo_024561 [Paulownia fortunei]
MLDMEEKCWEETYVMMWRLLLVRLDASWCALAGALQSERQLALQSSTTMVHLLLNQKLAAGACTTCTRKLAHYGANTHEPAFTKAQAAVLRPPGGGGDLCLDFACLSEACFLLNSSSSVLF